MGAYRSARFHCAAEHRSKLPPPKTSPSCHTSPPSNPPDAIGISGGGNPRRFAGASARVALGLPYAAYHALSGSTAPVVTVLASCTAALPAPAEALPDPAFAPAPSVRSSPGFSLPSASQAAETHASSRGLPLALRSNFPTPLITRPPALLRRWMSRLHQIRRCFPHRQRRLRHLHSPHPPASRYLPHLRQGKPYRFVELSLLALRSDFPAPLITRPPALLRQWSPCLHPVRRRSRLQCTHSSYPPASRCHRHLRRRKPAQVRRGFPPPLRSDFPAQLISSSEFSCGNGQRGCVPHRRRRFRSRCTHPPAADFSLPSASQAE